TSASTAAPTLPSASERSSLATRSFACKRGQAWSSTRCLKPRTRSASERRARCCAPWPWRDGLKANPSSYRPSPIPKGRDEHVWNSRLATAGAASTRRAILARLAQRRCSRGGGRQLRQLHHQLGAVSPRTRRGRRRVSQRRDRGSDRLG